MKRITQALHRTTLQLTERSRGRVTVFAQAGAIMAAILGCVWELHKHLTSHWVHETVPSLAVACLIWQAMLAVGGVALSGTIKKRDERRRRRSQRIQPVIRERLAAYCLAQTLPSSKGNDFYRLMKRHRDDFETCLLEFLNSAAGQSRERLSRLCTWLGLVEQWKRRASGGEARRARALEFLSLLSEDTGRPALLELIAHGPMGARASALDALTRLTASKGGRSGLGDLAGHSHPLSELFQALVSAPRLTRAMAAGALRGHAHELSAHGIPEVLRSPEVKTLLAALELVESWHCGLALEELTRLVHHPDPRVRAYALRLAPFDAELSFTPRARLAPLVLLGLHDSHRTVQSAALEATAKLQIDAALPLVEQCAESPDRAVASLACLALATMGAKGRAILQSKITGRDAQLAASAVESLGAYQLNSQVAHAAGAAR